MTDKATRIISDFKAIREDLANRVTQGLTARGYVAKHTTLLDTVLVLLAKDAELSNAVTLVAVGGYGRKELFPYSDVDLMVLLEENHDKSLDAAIESFIQSLWDTGLPIGATVREEKEVLSEAHADLSTATALIEARFLAGNKALFDRTIKAFNATLDKKDFFNKKVRELTKRHEKHGDSPYELEPNVKESPGGLRDIQTLRWLSAAALNAKSFEDVKKAGLLNKEELSRITEAEEELFKLRLTLHLQSKRGEDRLLFELQSPVAHALCFSAVEELQDHEALMHHFYAISREVYLITRILIEALTQRIEAKEKAPRVTLDSVFAAEGDELTIVDDDAFKKDKTAILRAFTMLADNRQLKGFTPRLMRSLWNARNAIDVTYRDLEENKTLLIHLFKRHYGVTHTLKALNYWGLLGRFIPAFNDVVGQLQHDLFHIYTVDQHTLMCVNYIRRFSHSSYAHEFPLASTLMTAMEKPWLLTFAAFFHDVGKGRGGEHPQKGSEIFLSFAKNYGFEEKDAAFIAFLITNHLVMSQVAQKKDIMDPDVITEFAKTVGDKDHLDALYVLTVADIRATSPKVWNSWKGQLLETLYKNTLAYFVGKSPATTIESISEKKQKEARAILKDKIDATALKRFWSTLDLVYFMRHDVNEIVWHAMTLARKKTDDLVLDIQSEKKDELKILIYVKDQKELFAKIVSSFEPMGLSAFDARINTTKDGMALDTFLVVDKRGHDDFRVFKSRLVQRLNAKLADGEEITPPKPGKLSRRSRSFPMQPFVRLEKDAAGRGFVLQVTCNDRMGLLYVISYVLARHKINLSTAKIATLDERVEDVFLVDGGDLYNEEAIVDIEEELTREIANAK